MSDIVIKAENVGKKFSKDFKSLMLYGVEDIAKSVLGITDTKPALRPGEFWAVDQVSFELKRGETLGLIGPNGSGKSTLLKMINGIFMPDTGRITVSGRVGALIQVGAGFHPMLTGRENIYVNGTILGMSKKEIDAKFDSIVDFADIGDFLDSPVRHYSSGMFVRLGFSVAIHCEPEILLIDEILAVGDVNFRRKCSQRMKEMEERQVTTIFVTHDLGSLRHICDRAICLNSGKTVYSGDLDGAITAYMTAPVSSTKSVKSSRYLKSVQLVEPKPANIAVVKTGETAIFGIKIKTDHKLNSPVIGLSIYDSSGNTVIGINTKKSNFAIDAIDNENIIYLKFPFLNLIPGNYSITVGLFDSSMGQLDNLPTALTFQVHSQNYSTGSVFAEHYWSNEL